MNLLSDMTYEEIKSQISAMNEKSFRALQLYQNLHSGKDYDQMTNIPAALKDTLSKDYGALGVKIEKSITAEDGTVKFLFALYDGNIVEGVLMKYKYGNTICVSTQVGCRMNCAFCASGLDGLIRNLSAGEMLAEVVLVNAFLGGSHSNRLITNVVLMGSGEPLDNYDNVIKFIRLLNSAEGLNISYRNVSLSTCGLVDKVYKLIDEDMPVTLTFSLHSPTDEVRSEIMPVNKAFNVDSVITAAKKYFDATGRRVIFEYSLINGRNDRDIDAVTLAKKLRGFPAHINLIVLNYVKERGLKSSGRERAQAFLKILEDNGASATIRRTMGADIEGACGQLRRRYTEEKNGR